jgi:hypothetical protein
MLRSLGTTGPYTHAYTPDEHPAYASNSLKVSSTHGRPPPLETPHSTRATDYRAFCPSSHPAPLDASLNNHLFLIQLDFPSGSHLHSY